MLVPAPLLSTSINLHQLMIILHKTLLQFMSSVENLQIILFFFWKISGESADWEYLYVDGVQAQDGRSGGRAREREREREKEADLDQSVLPRSTLSGQNGELMVFINHRIYDLIQFTI